MRFGINPDERKKWLLLALLSVLLSGVFGWQWLHREQPVPHVNDEVEHRALATFMEMLEAGRLRGWRNTEKYWQALPERPTQLLYQQWMGSRFRSEFTFQGSCPTEGAPGEILLFGMFDAGIPVEVRLRVVEDSFKIISMKKMYRCGD